MNYINLKQIKVEIQMKAKKGIDFILSAALIWFAVFYLWTLGYDSYERSIMTFMIGSLLLPLAFLLSKIFNTNWKVDGNPLQPLGLWLNFAQLFYFPFLIFTLINHPDYFIMAYAIITGAHLFPYTWFYDEVGYGIASVLISVGALLIALNVFIENIWIVPLFTSGVLFILAIWIYLRTNLLKYKQKRDFEKS